MTAPNPQTIRDLVYKAIDERTKGHGWAALLSVHSLHELDPDSGRCTECIESCDCASNDACTHGNASYPCPTIAIIGEALDVPGCVAFELVLAVRQHLPTPEEP